MKLIVGLGNPGRECGNNRHNVGHLVADALLAKPHRNLVVKKTSVFMNSSGEEVERLLTTYSLMPSDLFVIHDDLDIRLGEFKIQFGKGPRLHNGILSIEKELGTDDFWRVRVGVDNRSPDNRISGESYVLQDFTSDEKVILDRVILAICKKLATL
ncbi:MAG: aminoacyl-tRNA hydrolase [Candidatus Microgenomates bacterium]|jgi:PTH1 family peptidyl-tRNA hydrolase